MKSQVAIVPAEVTPLSSGVAVNPDEHEGVLDSYNNFITGLYNVTNAAGGFRIQWGTGTPAGARILNANNVDVATYPQEAVFNSNASFRIVVPGNTPPGELTVDIIANPVSPHNWLIFAALISTNQPMIVRFGGQFSGGEESSTQARMYWDNEPVLGGLRIIKRSQVTNQGLAGAVFTVTDSSGNLIAGSPFTTPANGTINIANLEPGVFTVTEISPPLGYMLSAPVSQTATIQAGQIATFEVVFLNPPTTTPPPTPPPPTPPPPNPSTTTRKWCNYSENLCYLQR